MPEHRDKASQLAKVTKALRALPPDVQNYVLHETTGQSWPTPSGTPPTMGFTSRPRGEALRLVDQASTVLNDPRNAWLGASPIGLGFRVPGEVGRGLGRIATQLAERAAKAGPDATFVPASVRSFNNLPIDQAIVPGSIGERHLAEIIQSAGGLERANATSSARAINDVVHRLGGDVSPEQRARVLEQMKLNFGKLGKLQ